MSDLRPEPDPTKTAIKAVVGLVLLVVAVTGMIYTAHLLWVLPAAPPTTAATTK